MISSRATALDLLRDRLHTAANRFTDAVLEHCLDVALAAISRDWPIWWLHELEILPGQRCYLVPDATMRVGVLFWGADLRLPIWAAEYAGPMPSVRLSSAEGGKCIEFSPPPTATQVMRWGARATVRLARAHELTAESTTLHDLQSHALLLRAQVEAMLALANGGVVQPIQRHQGMGASLPGNSTPAALAQQLLLAYRELVHAHSL
jgi:hypothetical protein